MESNVQPDQNKDAMPSDDASIEILSDSGDSHTRDSAWSIYSAGRSSIAGSDVSLMGFQKLSIHSKMATIVHPDGRQFIERRDVDDGGLPYSAEFCLNDGEVWKLLGDECLLLSHRRYFAKVTVEGTVDLNGVVGFEEAVRMLLKHVNVAQLFLDEELVECNKAKSVLKMILDKLADESVKQIHRKQDVMLLYTMLNKHPNLLSMDFKHDLTNSSRLSSEINLPLETYVTKALKLIERNAFLGHLNDSSVSHDFINDAVQKALTAHRARLASICSLTMQEKLKDLADEHILYVSKDDMNLFKDLTILDRGMFEAVLPKIFSKFLTRIREIGEKEFSNFDPLSNHIFLYVCKSLQEVAEQLGELTEADNAIIYSEALGWEVPNVQEESENLNNKCLKQQLQMLAGLANHFEPGGPFRTSPFPYEFKLFQNMDAIPEPVRIWLCLLDDSMKGLMQADLDKMEMLSCFFKSYVSFIASEDFRSETSECLRKITHDALRSLTDLKSSSQKDQNILDLQVCNETISRCLDKFLCDNFGNDCEQIQATLRRIISQATTRNVTTEESTEFSHAFRQLLKDISELPIEWYLQMPPSESRNLLLRAQFIVPVDNRRKDIEHECLKVVDPEGFVKMYKLLHGGEEIPKHYQLKAIQVLLDKLVAKQSCYEGDDMAKLIYSVRHSLLHLKSQVDYSCYEDFLKEVGESIAWKEERLQEVVDNRSSTMNVSLSVDPSHIYPVDFGEILDPLLHHLESSISKPVLTNSLKLYATQFNKHIKETVQLPREKRIAQIVSDVVLKVKPQLATSWTEEFKRSELPEALAGLSAVWSLIGSKNDSSSEKFIRPSSFQIGSVLSFFGDKNLKDDDLNRLLFISTQQGRELVLGLTAALLALYGHKVLIACFNRNLTMRNFIHLIEVFKSFSTHANISFGSVEDMARERSREVYERYAASFHETLGLEIKLNNVNQPTNEYRCKRSVLLIEDIELLFLKKTLAEVSERFVRPTIPGLALVQEMFFNRGLNIDEIDKFINQSGTPEMCDLKAFLSRPQSYALKYTYEGGERQYTNKDLFNAHLQELKNNTSHTNNMRLSRNGVIMIRTLKDCKSEHDVAYCRLKNTNFRQKVNGYNNYGFLTLGSISFPYVLLLKSYPLVFGFARTPLSSNDEWTTIYHYDIYHKIAESNLLHISTVKFNSEKDFCFYTWMEDTLEWMNCINTAINAAVARNCSVLVFFGSDVKMEEFQSTFARQLKQYSVTAFDTASNGENLAENEIAIDDITVLVVEPYGGSVEDRGVHVIQTFFSEDKEEECLIRRQAERTHGSGSYQLIVHKNHLTLFLGLKEPSRITYTYLEKHRFNWNRNIGDLMARSNENMNKYKNAKSICNKF